MADALKPNTSANALVKVSRPLTAVETAQAIASMIAPGTTWACPFVEGFAYFSESRYGLSTGSSQVMRLS